MLDRTICKARCNKQIGKKMGQIVSFGDTPLHCRWFSIEALQSFKSAASKKEQGVSTSQWFGSFLVSQIVIGSETRISLNWDVRMSRMSTPHNIYF